eukprot:TRINITY_DN18535_c0_g1_i3.p1 TRINITY_DN18535_c0_g1~~TRINITY_DN18535_c0_g1_i3.p1  ORF type:complete len:793 (+),score=178.29 TRINITY_DN18535_c0_g1_i3:82-2460(+)
MAGMVAAGAFDAPPRASDYHFVKRPDGTTLRCRLLHGGPHGTGKLAADRRTALCLHGLATPMAWWSEGVFRTGDMDPNYISMASASMGLPEEEVLANFAACDRRRREAFTRCLTKQMNVILVDQRGFGGSSRPASSCAEPFGCTSVGVVFTWALHDAPAFLAAAELEADALAWDTRCSSYRVAVHGAGAIGVVSMVYEKAFYLEDYLARQPKCKEQQRRLAAHASLLRVDVDSNQDETVDTSGLPADMFEPQKLFSARVLEGSFEVDRMGRRASTQRELTVVHKLADNADVCAEKIEKCLAAARSSPGGCLSLRIASVASGICMVGRFLEVLDAKAHIDRVSALWPKLFDHGLDGQLGLATVQVHGRRSVLAAWGALAPELASEVETLEQQDFSFDRNTSTTVESSVHEMAEDARAVLQHFGVPRATVVGYSMGAAVSLQLAAAYPDVVVAKMMFEDEALRRIQVPTLLAVAIDDYLTPEVASLMLKAALPNAEVALGEFGGHDVLLYNDKIFERVVRFMEAEEVMLFAEDTLRPEIIARGLQQDDALVRCHHLGCLLAEVEEVMRMLRYSRLEDPSELCQAQLDALASILRRAGGGLEHVAPLLSLMPGAECPGSLATRALLSKMKELLPMMKCESRGLVESLVGSSLSPSVADESRSPWWKTCGRCCEGYMKGQYTVDREGRRRGPCRSRSCAWYRWDARWLLSSGETQAALICWWCGGAPEEHEDIGVASDIEYPGYFLGIEEQAEVDIFEDGGGGGTDDLLVAVLGRGGALGPVGSDGPGTSGLLHVT